MKTEDPAARHANPITTSQWAGPICDGATIATIVFLVIVLSHQARFFPELGYDESAAYLGLQLLHGDFGFTIDPHGANGFSRYYAMDCLPPVYYMFSAAIFATSGFGIAQARLASILFLAATALLCYWTGRRIGGPAAGIAALAAYLYVPASMYVPVSRPDVAVPFFVLASLFALVSATETNRVWLFSLSGFLYGLAATSHFVTLVTAPLVGVLVWRAVGLQFWRSRAFWWYVGCFSIPWLGYAALIHPHYSSIRDCVLNYRHVAATSTGGSAFEIWPISSFVRHLQLLYDYFPAISYGLVVCVALLVAIAFWPTVRRRFTPASRIFITAFPVLVVLLGLYPNIGTIGYYAPVYIVTGAVACGLAYAALWPATRLMSTVATLIALSLLAFATHALWQKTEQRIRSVKAIPIGPALQWSEHFARAFRGPVIAVPHWVFSAARGSVRSYRALEPTAEGKPEFHRRLLSMVPDHPKFQDVTGAIVDQWTENVFVQNVLEKVWSGTEILNVLEQRFVTIGLFVDDGHLSGTYRVLEVLPTPTPEFPRLGWASAVGPVELTLDRSCRYSVEFHAPLTSLAGIPALRSVRIGRSSWTVRPAQPIFLRVVLRFPADDREPSPTFVALYPTSTAEDGSVVGLLSRQPYAVMNFVSKVGYASTLLPTGERGLDLLVTPTALGADPILTVYSAGPATLERIEAALTLKPGESCTDHDWLRVRRSLESWLLLSKPPLFASQPPTTVQVGELFSIYFSEPQTGEFVLWRDGNLLERQNFAQTQTASVRIKYAGNVGIEVWTVDPTTGTRSARAVHIKANN